MIGLKAIVPKEFLSMDKVRLELLNALRAEGRDLKRDFEGTVTTFTHKPAFTFKISLTRAGGGVTCYTSDANYMRLNDGTPAHFVPSYGVRTMTFFPRYKSKTRPGSLRSTSGGPMGRRITRRGRWLVRGIEARNFAYYIARNADKSGRFVTRVNLAIKRGLQKQTALGVSGA